MHGPINVILMCLTETRIYFVICRNLCHFYSNAAIPLLPGDVYAMVAHFLQYEPDEDFSFSCL